MSRVAFGAFTFDRDELMLRRGADVVPLTPKVAEALAILLETPGALVSKESLRNRLWPEGFVEDGNLTQTIYVLRKTLDPEGDGRTFIETVPRRGYRFVARVSPAQQRSPIAIAAVLAVVLLAGSFFAVAQSRARPYPALSTDAARAFKLGHYYWDKRTLDGTQHAIAYYQEVVRLAPRSPLGFVGLAEANVMIANHAMVRGNLKPYYAKAEAYAREALARDAQSGEALAMIGFIHYDRDMHLAQAESELRQAIALQPAFAEAQEFLGSVLFDEGKMTEAHEHFARAAALDPLCAPILRYLGISTYYAHDFTGAKRALRQALDLDGTEEMAAWYLIRTEEQLGEFRQAVALVAKQHAKNSATVLELRALRALIALKSGNRELAARMVPDLKPSPKPSHDIDVALLAAVNYQLGRHDDAVAWLRVGLRHNKPGNLRARVARDPELTGVCSTASVC